MVPNAGPKVLGFEKSVAPPGVDLMLLFLPLRPLVPVRWSLVPGPWPVAKLLVDNVPGSRRGSRLGGSVRPDHRPPFPGEK